MINKIKILEKLSGLLCVKSVTTRITENFVEEKAEMSIFWDSSVPDTVLVALEWSDGDYIEICTSDSLWTVKWIIDALSEEAIEETENDEDDVYDSDDDVYDSDNAAE